MLEAATERWQEPLSDDDWQDIHEGKYLFERRMEALRRYLVEWAKDYPERMVELLKSAEPSRAQQGPWAAIPTRDEPGAKGGFPADHRHRRRHRSE